MRAFIGRLAIVVGVILMTASAVVMVWGNGAAHRIPIGVDNFTRLSGTGYGLLAKSETPVAITNVTRTQSDPKASTNDVVAMQQLSCVALGTTFCFDSKGHFAYPKDDERIVNIGVDKYALNRATSYPVADQSTYIKDSTAVQPYKGLVTKFPFDTQKKDYPYWDGTLGHTVTAVYAGTRTINGVETYRFNLDVAKTNAEIAAGTQGTYESHQVLWVEPRTGAYVDQTVKQTVALPDGTVVLAVDLRYTPATVSANATDAKSNVQMLWALTVGMRVIAPILAIAFLGLGFVLTRRRHTVDASASEKQFASV